VALLLETFSLITFFDVNQRKLPAPQRENRHLKQNSQQPTPQGGAQTRAKETVGFAALYPPYVRTGDNRHNAKEKAGLDTGMTPQAEHAKIANDKAHHSDNQRPGP
jgi:hypothetical protein